MSNKDQMLRDIGIVDFTVVELALFLDTHPCDCNAIEYFNHYSQMSMQMKKEFSKTYYPLKLDFAESDKEWRWGNAPLPWEGVCG